MNWWLSVTSSLGEGDMTGSRLIFYVAILVASLISTAQGRGPRRRRSSPEERLEYQNHCAICHGVDGKGHGIMAKFLTISPSDLTQIAKKNAGRFSLWQVYRVIDGREELAAMAHAKCRSGAARFQADAKGSDPGSRAQAAGRLLLGFLSATTARVKQISRTDCAVKAASG